MHILRVGAAGAETPAVDDGGVIFDLSPLTSDITGSFLADDGIRRIRQALAAGDLPPLPQSESASESARIGAPISRPGAVICIGQNYAAHAAESGSAVPTSPVLFFKHPNTIVGPFDDVVKPAGATALDWEVELAVVIGATAANLSSPAEALACVAGYTIANDVSERVWQLEHSSGQWSKGKTAPTFNPLGPWLVPADEIADPQQLLMRSWVNGSPRQASSTSDMVFGVAELIIHLSHYMTLDPGDVINTGTPEGVGLSGRFPYLRGGDVFAAEIHQLGRMTQTIVDADHKH